MPSDAEIAWAAGFFEGEGCFTSYKNHRRKNGFRKISGVLAMTQKGENGRELLERFREIVGFGHIAGPDKYEMYMWHSRRAGDVKMLYDMFEKWLGKRRIQRAKEVMATEGTWVL